MAGSRLKPNGDLLKLHFRTYLAGSPLLSESYTGGLGWKPGVHVPISPELYVIYLVIRTDGLSYLVIGNQHPGTRRVRYSKYNCQPGIVLEVVWKPRMLPFPKNCVVIHELVVTH